MKPTFSYYGGKQRMVPNIIPLMPKHTVYVEPFVGSAAVFFAKPWPSVLDNNYYREVLNDTNRLIVNFYKVLRDNPEELSRVCNLTPYSRKEYREALRQETDNPVESARRWFVNIQQSFSHKSHGGWGTGVFGGNGASTWKNQCSRLLLCAERLHSVYIENEDALKVIERWDSPQTLFYCDPPYPGTVQGHYSGYTQEDFNQLVEALDNCQGSFLLSCYKQECIPDSWEQFNFSASNHSSGKGKVGINRDKSRSATKEELGDRERTEYVWRIIRGDNVRPEIKKLYRQGKFNCFKGKDETLPDAVTENEELVLPSASNLFPIENSALFPIDD